MAFRVWVVFKELGGGGLISRLVRTTITVIVCDSMSYLLSASRRQRSLLLRLDCRDYWGMRKHGISRVLSRLLPLIRELFIWWKWLVRPHNCMWKNPFAVNSSYDDQTSCEPGTHDVLLGLFNSFFSLKRNILRKTGNLNTVEDEPHMDPTKIYSAH